MKNYIQCTEEIAFAVNLKSASESIIRGIINQYQPKQLEGLHLPEGKTVEDIHLHSYATNRTDTPTGTVHLVVRYPVDRFISAMATVGDYDVDATLDEIESGGRVNRHYLPTSRLLVNTCKLYRFDTDLEQVATDLGIQLGTGRSFGTKPTLTDEQIARVETVYADDIALYNSITEAGQELVIEPEPGPLEPLSERLRAVTGAFPPEVKAGFPFERVAYWRDQGEEATARAVIAGVDTSSFPQAIQDAQTALLAEFDK